MDEEAQARTGARARPLEHLQITIGIAECGNRMPPDELLDTERLSRPIVDELRAGTLDDHRRTVTHLQGLVADAANHLFRRDAVRFFSERADELHAAATDDERLESVRAQV